MRETTAQEASGSTIALWNDLRVAVLFHADETARSFSVPRIGTGVWSNDPEPCSYEEAVDAAGPVDAENAPTGPWKTADGFPQAPTAVIDSVKKGESQGRDQRRPVTGQRQLPSAAAVASGAPFANPSPAEIVVVDRQK